MPTDPAPPHGPQSIQPIAAVLAFLFPGAGHFYLGHHRRAYLIALGILGLFFGGMLIGGVDVVDRKEDFVWFLGEALVGPVAFGVDAYHQNMLKAYDPDSPMQSVPVAKRSAHPDEARTTERRDVFDKVTKKTTSVDYPVFRPAKPGERPPNSKSIGRVNELGTLFCTIAGMLNLICIIDALFRQRGAPGVSP
jgi:TM2 domain-containing membrane protein YozV